MTERSFRFYRSGMMLDALMYVDVSSLRLLAAQLAANLITNCKDYPVNAMEGPTVGAGAEILRRMNWASNGADNAFQSQASLLYGIVEIIIDSRGTNFYALMMFDDEQAFSKLLADGLSAYQEWKERVCDLQRKEHGENWGSATGFFKMDWTNLNKKLLNPYKVDATP